MSGGQAKEGRKSTVHDRAVRWMGCSRSSPIPLCHYPILPFTASFIRILRRELTPLLTIATNVSLFQDHLGMIPNVTFLAIYNASKSTGRKLPMKAHVSYVATKWQAFQVCTATAGLRPIGDQSHDRLILRACLAPTMHFTKTFEDSLSKTPLSNEPLIPGLSPWCPRSLLHAYTPQSM